MYVGNEENKLDKAAWAKKWISEGLAGKTGRSRRGWIETAVFLFSS